MMKGKQGFTLIEVTVVTAIVALLASMIFYNAPAFNRRLVLTRAARETGSFLRDAEARAISVHSANCATPPCFPPRYGVSFNSQSVLDAQSSRSSTPLNEEVILFADRAAPTPNSIYDPGPCGGAADECVAWLRFLNGVHIHNILIPGTPTPDFTSLEVTTLHVVYEYPHPKVIATSDLGDVPDTIIGPFRVFFAPSDFVGRCYDAATGVKDPACREIQVWRTGQIALME